MLCWSLLGKVILAAAPVPHPTETWHRGGHTSWLPLQACHSNSNHFLEQIGAFVCCCKGEHLPRQPHAQPGACPRCGQRPCLLGTQVPNPPGGAEGAGITVFKYGALNTFPGNCCFHGKC